jgi:hypothetical protein
MKDAMAYIMFLCKAHVDDIVDPPGAPQDEHTERIRKQLLADPCGEAGTPRTPYWFRAPGGDHSGAIRTKPGLRLQDLNQKVYVPDGAKPGERTGREVGPSPGCAEGGERMVPLLLVASCKGS